MQLISKGDKAKIDGVILSMDEYAEYLTDRKILDQMEEILLND